MSTKDYSHVPDWCRPGEYAVEIGGRSDSALRRRTILRVTKTTVVTDGPNDTETRYKIWPDGEIMRRGGTWDPSWTLAPITDPEVQRRIKENRRKSLAVDVEQLALRWRRDGDHVAALAIAQRLVDAGVIASYEPVSTEQDQ